MALMPFSKSVIFSIKRGKKELDNITTTRD